MRWRDTVERYQITEYREKFSQGSMETINSRTTKCGERFSQGGVKTSNSKTTNRREERMR